MDFPEIPEDHIEVTFAMFEMFYAPTYFALLDQQLSSNPPYVKEDADARRKRANAKKKGKRKAAAMDEGFEKERKWLVAKLQKETVDWGGKPADVQAGAGEHELEGCCDEEEEEGTIECGCCFTEYPFVCVVSSYSCVYERRDIDAIIHPCIESNDTMP